MHTRDNNATQSNGIRKKINLTVNIIQVGIKKQVVTKPTSQKLYNLLIDGKLLPIFISHVTNEKIGQVTMIF